MTGRPLGIVIPAGRGTRTLGRPPEAYVVSSAPGPVYRLTTTSFVPVTLPVSSRRLLESSEARTLLRSGGVASAPLSANPGSSPPSGRTRTTAGTSTSGGEVGAGVRYWLPSAARSSCAGSHGRSVRWKDGSG